MHLFSCLFRTNSSHWNFRGDTSEYASGSHAIIFGDDSESSTGTTLNMPVVPTTGIPVNMPVFPTNTSPTPFITVQPTPPLTRPHLPNNDAPISDPRTRPYKRRRRGGRPSQRIHNRSSGSKMIIINFYKKSLLTDLIILILGFSLSHFTNY